MADKLSKDYPHDQDVDDDPLAGFDTFYAEYPKHEARKDAEKAWKQIKAGLDPQLRERIMENVRTRAWPREKRFVPLPATYLRGARYDDEAVTADAVPVTPANRWMPSKAKGSRIPDGHQWCEHDPLCADDLSHIRKTIAEKEGAE
jgi:hypothetical protein